MYIIFSCFFADLYHHLISTCNFVGGFELVVSFSAGIAPFGQLPLLEIKDDTSPKPIVLCQSVAILRYLANEFGRCNLHCMLSM